MKRLIDVLAPLGLLVIVAARAWSIAGKTPLPGQERYYLIAGTFLIVAHLILRFDSLVNMIGKRQLRYGGNAVVFSLVVLAIVIAINWLVSRNTKRWDLTKNQRYSLSDQTKKVLQGLKEDVSITYFQRGTALAAGQDRLKDYQSASPHIKVSFVDPVQNPAKATAMDAKGPWPILILERASARERITNDSEQDITNGLIKVTRDKKKTVCFVEGEGERDIEQSGDQGLSGAKAALGKSQYETKKVLLLREKNVPAECTVLVVSGPEKDLLPDAIDAIRRYVKDGGKAFVMVDPELKESYPNLVALLKEWNLELAKDIVVDVSGMGQLFGAGEFTPIVAQYPYHEITKDFRLMTLFHMARSVTAGKASLPNVTAQNLLETSPRSWAETDLSLKGDIKYDEGKDRMGPISIGAVATIRSDAPAPTPSPSPGADEAKQDKKEGRVVAIGDSDFATNQLLGFQGNQDFFLNSVAWLAQDADLISIRPKEPEDQRLFLSRTQQQFNFWFAVAVLPGLFIVMGVANWWRRR
jgi:ABC-type uncharacterized transport system involved in gliding motility auxiliary subunit